MLLPVEHKAGLRDKIPLTVIPVGMESCRGSICPNKDYEVMTLSWLYFFIMIGEFLL